MTAPTAPAATAFSQFRHAEAVASALADACDSRGLICKAFTIDAYSYGGASANLQFGGVEAVDEFAAMLDLAPDNPDDPHSEKRADGLPTLYSRSGRIDGASVTAYCRRP